MGCVRAGPPWDGKVCKKKLGTLERESSKVREERNI